MQTRTIKQATKHGSQTMTSTTPKLQACVYGTLYAVGAGIIIGLAMLGAPPAVVVPMVVLYGVAVSI